MTYKEALSLPKGQHVMCNAIGIYGVTKPGVLCSILEFVSNEVMTVKVLQEGRSKGSIFPVRIEYFDPVFDGMRINI